MVAGGYAPELLELVKEALDTVSILISPKVTGGRVFPVGLRWDDGPDPVDQQFFA